MELRESNGASGPTHLRWFREEREPEKKIRAPLNEHPSVVCCSDFWQHILLFVVCLFSTFFSFLELRCRIVEVRLGQVERKISNANQRDNQWCYDTRSSFMLYQHAHHGNGGDVIHVFAFLAGRCWRSCALQEAVLIK